MKYRIEVTPFAGQFHGGCHYAVIGPSGFVWAGGCGRDLFDAVAIAFGVARRWSRAKTFAVRVVA